MIMFTTSGKLWSKVWPGHALQLVNKVYDSYLCKAQRVDNGVEKHVLVDNRVPTRSHRPATRCPHTRPASFSHRSTNTGTSVCTSHRIIREPARRKPALQHTSQLVEQWGFGGRCSSTLPTKHLLLRVFRPICFLMKTAQGALTGQKLTCDLEGVCA